MTCLSGLTIAEEFFKSIDPLRNAAFHLSYQA